MLRLFVVVVLSSCHFVLGSELCKDKEWFSDIKGECQPCKACSTSPKQFEMSPCSEFTDAICVNLDNILRNIEFPKSRDVSKKWHEKEGSEKKFIATETYSDNTSFKEVIIVIVGISFMILSFGGIWMVIKCYGNDNTKRSPLERLFSWDRLNTTEYMNNLATLDRRLTIEEIIEKRKRAIFEPQLLNENLYTDEVFVDISGLPKNLRHSHDYEEVENRRSLLQIQDQN